MTFQQRVSARWKALKGTCARLWHWGLNMKWKRREMRWSLMVTQECLQRKRDVWRSSMGQQRNTGRGRRKIGHHLRGRKEKRRKETSSLFVPRCSDNLPLQTHMKALCSLLFLIPRHSLPFSHNYTPRLAWMSLFYPSVFPSPSIPHSV